MYLQNATKKFLNDNKEYIEKNDWREVIIKAFSLGRFNPAYEDILELLKSLKKDATQFSKYKKNDIVELNKKNLYKRKINDVFKSPQINNSIEAYNGPEDTDNESIVASIVDVGVVPDPKYFNIETPFVYAIGYKGKLYVISENNIELYN